MSHAIITPRTYAVIFAVLLGLTALTVVLADAHLSPLGHIAVALAIAGTKALLVGVYFMHLIHSPRLTWLVVACGVLFLGIMMITTLSDYWTRPWLPQAGVPATRSVTTP